MEKEGPGARIIGPAEAGPCSASLRPDAVAVAEPSEETLEDLRRGSRSRGAGRG